MNPALRYIKSADIAGPRIRSIEIAARVLILSLILVATSSFYFIFEPSTLKWLAQEDGLVENFSAVNWFMAAVIMFVLFAKRKNVWFLLLGILFVVCFGEELSWGQRLFGFATPESIRTNNFQGEFNLHNLNFFERRHGDKGFWGVMRDVGRMFAIFWFLYGIVLPASLKLSDRLRRFVKYIRLPVMPLAIGLFFMVNYVVFQYFEDHHVKVCAYFGWVNNANVSSLPVELREWFDSLLYLFFVVEVFASQFKAERIVFDKRNEVVFDSHRPGLQMFYSRQNRLRRKDLKPKL